MQILQTAITRAELATLAQNVFGNMIKCVADVRLGLLALDAELHADLELVDLTIKFGRTDASPMLRSAMLEELCRFRELYCKAYLERDLPEQAAFNRYLDCFCFFRSFTSRRG